MDRYCGAPKKSKIFISSLDKTRKLLKLRPLKRICRKVLIMAKKNIVLVKLQSTADTGFFYVKKKNPKKQTEKMSFSKYDAKVRKHVIFNETKLK